MLCRATEAIIRNLAFTLKWELSDNFLQRSDVTSRVLMNYCSSCVEWAAREAKDRNEETH